MSTSLAIKYRPKDWESVCGQEAVVKVLRKQLEDRCFRHCYLFYGLSGSGKTTTARIFACGINKNHGEPIEIDAASNSGVDNIRDIIERANERSIDSEYKVYILDEVQHLSAAAWGALLKLLEEPPEHVVFILCTTEVQKVPLTIRNRSQVYNFAKINTDAIAERLRYICARENISNFTESVDYIAKISNGGMRNALTYLDKCISFSKNLDIDICVKLLGRDTHMQFFNLTHLLMSNKQGDLLQMVESYSLEGVDFKVFVDDLINFYIDVLKYYFFKDFSLIRIPDTFKDDLASITSFRDPIGYYNYLLDGLLDLKNMMRNDINPKSTVEIVFLKLSAQR